MTPVLEVMSEEVLKVARKRHQSGQMCPEILNLLTKGEIILDLAVDDEVTTQRLPIPLLFRPLRQLVYGVLFGVKMTKDASQEEVTPQEEILENCVLDDQKSIDNEKENSNPEEVVVNGDEKEVVSEEEEETEPSPSVDVEDEPKDDPPDENNPKFIVKEWCIYGDKKLDQPDLVEAKGR